MRTSIINADKAKKYRIFYKIVAAAVWIMVWQLTSMYLKQEILLASPVSVIKRLTELIVMGDFWKSVVFSFVRIILGFSLAEYLRSVRHRHGTHRPVTYRVPGTTAFCSPWNHPLFLGNLP